ncbi:MAG: hypothetical protein M3Z36_04910 [Acidobacteriota bacterium]|nr:hypothetical protein [Acidobacteriota bacterium]
MQLNQSPTRVIGQTRVQLQPSSFSQNLVEGRELAQPQGIALDMSANPAYLYVSDTANNRVLGFRNSAAFANGQHADIVIGQPDFFTTVPQGPSRQGARSTGLSSPVGLAVDSRGALYVVDAGNNRILRFPQPFAQSEILPDLVIGQSSFISGGANGGGAAASASTLSFSVGSSGLQAYLAFDKDGNLWVADAGNNRVLRFPAAVLGASASNSPSGDLVLGQFDFITTTYVNPTADKTVLTAIRTPTGIAFDPSGRLFVSESNNQARGRILVYTPPFSTGKLATRLLGVSNAKPPLPDTSDSELQAGVGNVFMIGSNPAIADTLNSRILVYKPYEQWTADLLTQPAQFVIGQPNFAGNGANRRQPEAGPDTLALPTTAVFSGSELFVVDTLNNRVLVLPQTGNSFGAATRVLGQDQFDLNTVNLVEGREFNFSSGQSSSDAGIIADLRSDPPRLYVADTYNNRILGFSDLRKVKPGDRADIVIGQPDFLRTLVNYPSNDVNKPTASSLFTPTGLALDAAGNLYVADSGNGRVLRFPQPFANRQRLPAADLVLGQSTFTSKITDASARTMAGPYGLAFAGNTALLVSDVKHHRVLYFAGRADALTSGMAATKVFGQPDFSSSAAGATDNRMNGPHHIATDTDDRLYVADTGNNRVTIFDRVSASGSDPRPAVTLGGLSSPQGVYVSADTGDIWVADGSNRALRYPKFNDLAVSANFNYAIPSPGPRALTLDAFGNLYVADLANRVAIYYPGLIAQNAANNLQTRALAPGTVAAVAALGNVNQFGSQTVSASSLPLPRQLGGIQVLLNDQPVPLYFVSPNQINFLVPMDAPTSGTADLLIVRTDTGQVLSNSPIQMDRVSPGLFTLPQTGSGQAAAINQDGTINGPQNPAPRGSIVAFYGTGQGVVPGAPPDGTAPTGETPTPQKPQVIIGIAPVPPENVTYSGLAPGLAGVWQVNVKIPDTVAPTTSTVQTQVVLVLNSIPSGGGGLGRPVTMWVK